MFNYWRIKLYIHMFRNPLGYKLTFRIIFMPENVNLINQFIINLVEIIQFIKVNQKTVVIQ